MEGATKKNTRRPPLEYYMQFIENPKDQYTHLNKDQLNQIINIHGFQRLLQCRKSDLVEALSSINLLSPVRSTLKENVCSASLSFEELIQDNYSISWHDDVVDDDVVKVKSSVKRKRQPLQESTNTFVIRDDDPVDATTASTTMSCVSHGCS